MELKNIYRGREIKFYDMLQEHKQGLLDDFLKLNPEWLTVQDSIAYETENGEFHKRDYEDGYISKKQGWNVLALVSQFNGQPFEEQREKYPTAFKLIDFFGKECKIATYSTFEPGNILRRHTGPENREAKNIRIHIPLIIPKGDVGFEVHGEEIHWDDIFAFNNQKAHSAWNLTSERRLIFIIDLTRHICDLPPAPVWYQGCNDDAPGFAKTETTGEIWKNSVNSN